MKHPSAQSTRDLLVSSMRNAILSGEFQPGQLLTQDMIADLFGVSRMPVRQALELLAFDGFVTCRPNRSAVVNCVDETFIREYFEIRCILEGMAFSNACIKLNGSEDAVRELENILQEGEQAVASQDSKMFDLYNYNFHRYFWERCGNERLHNMVSQLWYGMHAIVSERGFDENSYTSHKQHIKIAEAVFANNYLDCGLFFSEHIITSRQLTLYKFQQKKKHSAS